MNEIYLKLKELMKLDMKDIQLKHKGVKSECVQTIPEFSLKCLSKYGKEMWKDMLDAKVESFDNGKLQISGIGEERFREFRNMFLGKCTPELYEKCIVKPGAYIAGENEKPDKDIKTDAVDLIATYEEIMDIPDKERMTAYFGDYGMHYMTNDFDMDKARNIMNKALKSMGTSLEQFNASKELGIRQNIRLRMREGMMAEKIKVDDTIVFVTPEPLSAPDEIETFSGIINSIDTDAKTCNVKTMFENTEVPFRYILAKYNEQLEVSRFGYDHVETLLGINQNDVQTLLNEAKDKYERMEALLKKKFQLVTIFYKPVLFTSDRIKRADLPKGVCCYDIRHDDECKGDMAQIKDYVMVNHWGTVISKEPFEPREECGHLYTTADGLTIEDDDYNYLSEDYTIDEYKEKYTELAAQYAEQDSDGMKMEM